MIILSIVIPVYNEGSTIQELLRKVQSVKLNDIKTEVIVINDGSTDDTMTVLDKVPELYDQLIVFKQNQGKGAAVKQGLENASGDYIIFQDGDLEYDPQEYVKIVEPVIRFNADIVIGSRLIASPITRVSYFWHKVGNRLITLIFNVLNNTTFTDVYSCYLLYRRSLVDPKTLRTFGWEQHAEILSIAIKNANSVFEVPISYFGRSYDEGKKIRAHHTIKILWTMIKRRVN